jgi:hypothetical protein
MCCPPVLLARLSLLSTRGSAATLIHSICPISRPVDLLLTLPSHVIMTATDIYKGASSEQAQSKRAQPYDNQHNQSLSRPTTQSQRARINTSPRGRLSFSFYIPNILTPFSCLCLSSDFVRISAAMSVVPTKVRETMPSMTC